MILWLTGAVIAALVAGVWALAANARAYVRRAEARWPPQGRFIDHDGVSLHVMEAGAADAPRLLLIHGASANLRELWRPLASALAEDHRVIAYDRPGMGFSARGRRGAHTLGSQAQCAARVLEQTGSGAALIVGHSLGAAVALRLALDFPQHVAGLVLIAPASHPYPGQPAWWARLSAAPLIGHAFAGLIVPWLGPVLGKAGAANNFAPAPTPKEYWDDAGVGLIFRPRAFRASAKDVAATKAEFAAQAPSYPEIMAPAIIVSAERDKVVSPKRHARALAVDMPAAELVTAPGAGHMPHRLRTDLVLSAIRRVDEMVAAPVQR